MRTKTECPSSPGGRSSNPAPATKETAARGPFPGGRAFCFSEGSQHRLDDASVTEVYSRLVTLAGDRSLTFGQLLVKLLHEYRKAVPAVAAELGYADIRPSHLQVFAHMSGRPVRLSDLAARAQLSLAAASEFVSDLERLGYLVRRPDPDDGRARLIALTEKGRQVFKDGRAGARKLDAQWARLVGARRFEQASEILRNLLEELQSQDDARKASDLRLEALRT